LKLVRNMLTIFLSMRNMLKPDKSYINKNISLLILERLKMESCLRFLYDLKFGKAMVLIPLFKFKKVFFFG